jgi:5-methyltetrahydropteroyltriglutamate--homocysteine methyltransferase
VREAVADVARRQLELGLDVIADGEMSKPSFLTYASERLGGFELDPGPSDSPWAGVARGDRLP